MYQFFRTCVDTPPPDVPALSRMIEEAQQVNRRTFMLRCPDARQTFLELGYAAHPAQGLTAAGDYHVGYFRSRWKGRRCYFFTWSAIEHIFLEEGVYA